MHQNQLIVPPQAGNGLKSKEMLKSDYTRLMKASNTPDERDKDKGINRWIAFFALLFSLSIFYFILTSI